MFLSIDHPAIACHDTQRQIDWYCSVLGMRVIASNGQTPPSAVIGYDHDTRGGAMLEMMPVRDIGPHPSETPRFCQGLRHLALRVTNFDATFSKLQQAGIAFLSEPVQAVGGGKIVSFRDPEGNELQIVER